MLLIYPVLGLLAFQKAEDLPSSSVRLFLILTGKDTKAQGTETSEGFVVYAGSSGRAEAVPSIHAYGTQIRGALIEKGVFVVDGPNLRLNEDYVFPSPSTAAMVLLGRPPTAVLSGSRATGRRSRSYRRPTSRVYRTSRPGGRDREPMTLTARASALQSTRSSGPRHHHNCRSEALSDASGRASVVLDGPRV